MAAQRCHRLGPARSVLRDFAAGQDVRLSAVSRRLITRFAEVDENVQPYWQRTVFEVHPELSFFQLNEDRPLRYSKHRQVGVAERTALLKARLPGVEGSSTRPWRARRRRTWWTRRHVSGPLGASRPGL